MGIILKQKIQSRVAWKGRDLRDGDAWVLRLSDHALGVLDAALRATQKRGLKAPGFAKADFPIDDAAVLAEIARWSDELENGLGFFLLRGLPADRYDEDALTALYYGIGLYMGQPVTQNARGDLLGNVMNAGERKKSTRVYETNAYLPYHSDLSDVVGLLCLRKARTGGLSSLVSSATVYNEILEKHPEYLAYFYNPLYYDHMGEELPSLTPLFSYHEGKLSSRYLRAYIELGHERRGVPLSRVAIEALDLFDALMQDPDLRLDMMLEPGDMQFCNNYAILHSRTHFEDFDEPEKRRKLSRLWLKMPNARTLAPDFPGRNGIPATGVMPDY